MNSKAISMLGKQRIERRRIESEQRRQELAAKLIRYDKLVQENERLRGVIARAAGIIEHVIDMRSWRDANPPMVDGEASSASGSQGGLH